MNKGLHEIMDELKMYSAVKEGIDDFIADIDGVLNTIRTDTDISRYRTLESAATRLQKESKGYLDSLRGT